MLGYAPADFVRALSSSLHFPYLDGAALFASAPDFNVIPLAEALNRECVVVRAADGGIAGVFADPFDTGLFAWLDARLRGAPLYLVHPADLAAYLARHEEDFRAVDNVATTDNELEIQADDAVETLSLVRISEDTSPVVKLVNSTLYDALKAGASDIHLETTATGLAIKYRVDGVLTVISRGTGPGDGRAGDLAHQGDGRTRYRRAPRTAGRPLQGAVRAARSTSACRSCRASSARTRCCASSTSRT